ncbi:permease-like cell division protein FtsX [Actinomadura terrae]|uniref:permease-like cell division protein FtsX n=1 Tax=Actinomadura terrae TaxID=604353 RepID=UPI001FA762A2|nr:permease-like cell division protein FtsX [Actinomadura terrae]
MNTTENRLREALKTVGDTMGPEDVPPMRTPVTRRFGLAHSVRSGIARPAVLVSVCAAVLVLMGGLAVGAVVMTRDGNDAASSSGDGVHVTVFLCTKTSSNASCGHADATEVQKANIRRTLEGIRQVRRVEYESKLQAYERFKKAFSDKKEWENVKIGDIPDAFRVRVLDGGARTVKQTMLGVPGVDSVVDDQKPPA